MLIHYDIISDVYFSMWNKTKWTEVGIIQFKNISRVSLIVVCSYFVAQGCFIFMVH